MAGSGDMLPVAFWLVPSEPWRATLVELIAALGAAHEGLAFEPHITLEVNHARRNLPLEALLDRVAASFEPMTLVAGETAHSEVHFKTLYVEFDDPRLFALQRALREHLGRDDGYALRPHLSLLYRGGLACDIRERLAEAHRLDGEHVAFDTLVVVRPSQPGGDLSAIEAIDTSLRRRLGAL